MNRLLACIDTLSRLASWLARAVVVVLVAAMIFEVAARYFFQSPTIWAFDISYMCTGAMFVLGTAWALREDAHVRIDVLSSRFPPPVRRCVEGVAFLLVLCPIVAAIAWVAVRRTWDAWVRQEVEMVSPWAPLMWPFYASLALGLGLLALQLAAEGVRAFCNCRDAAAMQERA